MDKQAAREYARGMKEANTQAHFDMFIDIAIECIEKQTPKKPIINLWDEWCECPVCDGIVTIEETKLNYCPDCGQAIDWSDNEWE